MDSVLKSSSGGHSEMPPDLNSRGLREWRSHRASKVRRLDRRTHACLPGRAQFPRRCCYGSRSRRSKPLDLESGVAFARAMCAGLIAARTPVLQGGLSASMALLPMRLQSPFNAARLRECAGRSRHGKAAVACCEAVTRKCEAAVAARASGAAAAMQPSVAAGA